MQLVAVELLSQIEGPSASLLLAVLAVEKPSADVRERAAKVLAHRDPRDVIGWLINVVHRPFKYEIKPGAGPGTTGALLVDGERFDIRRFYRFPDVQLTVVPPAQIAWNAMLLTPTPVAGTSGSSASQAATMMTLSGRAFVLAQQQYAASLLQEATMRDQVVQQKLESDVQTIEEVNAQIKQTLLPKTRR
jgi:hypothetical protein